MGNDVNKTPKKHIAAWKDVVRRIGRQVLRYDLCAWQRDQRKTENLTVANWYSPRPPTSLDLNHILLESSLRGSSSTDIHLVSDFGRRVLRSSTNRTLTVLWTHHRFGDRSFAVAGLRLRNICRKVCDRMTIA